MTTIAEMARRWRTVDLNTAVPEIIQSDEAYLIQQEKDRLYEKSLLATGQRLDLYSNIRYAIDKEKMNPQPGFLHPDLKVTGDFYGGFTMNVKAPYIMFSSDDVKTEELEGKYTKYIFGLTKEQKTAYATSIFHEKLKTYITGKTGCKFK